MKPRYSVDWNSIQPPAPGRPGSVHVTVHYPRPQKNPVHVQLVARTDHEGRSVTIQSGSAAPWDAGLVWAAFRWSPGDGPPELLLWWPGTPPKDMPEPPRDEWLNSAEVSDVVLLARDRTAQWAVQAFFETLPTMGRPPGLTNIEDDEQIRVVVRQLRTNHTRVTQENVVAWAGTFTLSALRNYLRVTGRKWAEIIDT